MECQGHTSEPRHYQMGGPEYIAYEHGHGSDYRKETGRMEDEYLAQKAWYTIDQE